MNFLMRSLWVQRKLKLRLANGQHRPLLILPYRKINKKPYKPDWRNDIDPAKEEYFAMPVRLDEPVKSDDTHNEQPRGHHKQPAPIPFQIARKKYSERNDKMYEKHEVCDDLPSSMNAVMIPNDLFRQITRVSDNP